jgi:hypothetical protein
MARGLDLLYGTDGIFEELWSLIEGHVVPIWFRDFPVLERESTDMKIFEAQLVTGLLQTEDYAREVLQAAGRTGALDERVAARMARQEILTGEGHPRLWVVFDEPVIHRVLGSRGVMRAQYDRLLAAAAHPKISIRVIPAACGGHAGLDGSFILLKLQDGRRVLWSDGIAGGLAVDAGDRVEEAAVRFDLIRDNALTVEDSVALIGKAREQL